MIHNLTVQIYLFFIGIYEYFCFINRSHINPIIITDEDISIVSINPSENIKSTENILNYLRHNILGLDCTFEKEEYKKPVAITFKYLNKNYKICLKSLSCNNKDHGVICETPKILSALIGENDVTDLIKEFHGTTRNFYVHIPDAVSDLFYLLGQEGELHIYNTMGKYEMYNLQNKITNI